MITEENYAQAVCIKIKALQNKGCNGHTIAETLKREQDDGSLNTLALAVARLKEFSPMMLEDLMQAIDED